MTLNCRKIYFIDSISKLSLHFNFLDVFEEKRQSFFLNNFLHAIPNAKFIPWYCKPVNCHWNICGLSITRNFLTDYTFLTKKVFQHSPPARAEKPFQGLVLNHYHTETSLNISVGRQDHTVNALLFDFCKFDQKKNANCTVMILKL